MDGGNIADALHGPAGECQLPAMHLRKADAAHIVDGRVKAHRTGGIDCTGLKLAGQLRKDRTLAGDGLDHLTAGEERRHFLQQRLFAV